MHLVQVKLVLQTNHHTMQGTSNIKIDVFRATVIGITNTHTIRPVAFSELK